MKYEVVAHPKHSPSVSSSLALNSRAWSVRNTETGRIGEHAMTHVIADGMATVLNRGQYSPASEAAKWAKELDAPVSDLEQAREDLRKSVACFCNGALRADFGDDGSLEELVSAMEEMVALGRAILPTTRETGEVQS